MIAEMNAFVTKWEKIPEHQWPGWVSREMERYRAVKATVPRDELEQRFGAPMPNPMEEIQRSARLAFEDRENRRHRTHGYRIVASQRHNGPTDTPQRLYDTLAAMKAADPDARAYVTQNAEGWILVHFPFEWRQS